MRRWSRALVAGLCVAASPASAEAEMRLFVFEIEGCTACTQFHTEALQDYWTSETSRSLPLTIVDLNALGTAGQPLRAPIRTVPTFIVMRDGIEIARLTGYPGKQALEAGIAQVLADEAPTASIRPLP